ncbi:conserved hypothetical protein [Ricinus communis]|uniref:MATH domain-containing protein n=1 Tax=Ricinus communis TaxID=3988 RepID=B9T132_RICCO|nr:conserved hypothetical protein [Ricinus communis]
MISSSFQVGEGNLRIHLCRTMVDGIEYLSLVLDIKDTEKRTVIGRSLWCLFRICVFNQKPGLNHVHRNSYGRFSGHGLRDDTTLGWTQYLKMSDFTSGGFLVDDTVVIGVSFHAIREFSTVDNLFEGKSTVSLTKKGEGCSRKFVWKIVNFVGFKGITKKKKLTGLCIKSRTFRVGNMDFRLLVYPKGKYVHSLAFFCESCSISWLLIVQAFSIKRKEIEWHLTPIYCRKSKSHVIMVVEIENIA